MDAQAYKLKQIRCLSLYDPYYFEKVVCGFEKIADYFHGKELNLFVDNLTKGLRKQWIEFPRGHYKTTCFTIGMSTWFVLPSNASDREFALNELQIPADLWDARTALQNVDFAQLLAFETIGNATRKIEEIKWIFERQLFAALFPEIAADGTELPWSNEKLKIRRTEKGRRIGEATFQAAGVGTALQSQHYDVIWEDDLVGKDARDSQNIMASTIAWHQLLNGVRNGPILGMKTRRIGVSNMWAYNDLNNHVRKNEKDWYFHTRKLTEMNPESGMEEVVFPVDGKGNEAFSQDEIQSIRESMTDYDFNCQYFHVPIRPGNESVNKENLHIYTVEPGGEIVCSCGFKVLSSNLRRYGHIDPSSAKATSTSCAAIAVVGLSPCKHVILLDYSMSKPSYGQFYDKIVEFNDLYWPDEWTYEDVGLQNMVEYYLRQMEREPDFKKKHQYFRRIRPATTKGKTKERRIADFFFPLVDKGKFAVRKSHQIFVNMLSTFPNPVFDHDYDLLDALAQGPPIYRWPVSEEAAKTQKREEDDILTMIGRPYGYRGELVQ